MAAPKPHVPLTGHCSVISNNTLYIYSPEAFQSLPLQAGAEWSELDNGVPVTGAACVLVQSSGGDAMWVVGGSTSNTQYPGLQQYTFSTNNWTTIHPVVDVTKNRLSHSAVFLQDAASVLVYSGSQNDPSIPSVETFLISTKAPYGVQSYTSHNVPGSKPLLLPWNGTSAITIGGTQENTEVFMFQSNGIGGAWSKYQTSLPQPLKDSTQQQAIIVDASDNSKVLEIYDPSVSPWTVENLVLQAADGKPTTTGVMVGGNGRRRRRDLTLNNWPTYNNTFAPTTAKTDFGIAQGSNGLVAVYGGADGNSVELFNQNKNSWVNTADFFGQQSVIAQSVSPTTSTTLPTATSASTTSPTSTPTDTPLPVISHHSKTAADLGAILGSILGFVAVLLAILAILECRRRRSKGPNDSGEVDNDEEKHRLSFADRGAPFMKEAGGAVSYPKGARFDSFAIIGAQSASSHRRTATHGSDSSTTKLVPIKGSAFGMNDAMEMEIIREQSNTPTKSATLQVPQGDHSSGKPKRSSGWSRYFSGADMLSIQSKSPRNSQRPTSRHVQLSMSRRRSSGAQSTTSSHNCGSHGPTEIPTLEFGPHFNESNVRESFDGVLPARQDKTTRNTENWQFTSEYSRPNTLSRASSNLSISTTPASLGDETIFTQDRHDGMSTWTPVTGSTWSAARPRDTGASSVYESEMSDASLQKPFHKPVSAAYGDMRASTNPFLSGIGNAAESSSLTSPAVKVKTVGASVAVPAQKTVVETSNKQPEKAVVNSDMSWLNLGAVSTR